MVRSQRVKVAQELRNALVHNQGQYMRAYPRTKLAYRPTEEDLHGFAPPTDDAALIDREAIPLSFTSADPMIARRDLASLIEAGSASVRGHPHPVLG